MGRVRLSLLATWVGAAYACVLLLSLFVLVLGKGGGVFPGLLYSVFLACWLSLPAALAASFVTSSKHVWTARAYFAAQLLVVASSAWLLPPVFLIADAQNGIALAFLTFLQGGAVLLFAGLVWLVQTLTLRCRA